MGFADMFGPAAMQAAGPQINIFKYPIVKCEQCGNNTFQKAAILRKIPGIVLGITDVEELSQPCHSVYVCSKCGAILQDDIDMMEKEEKEYEQIEKFKNVSDATPSNTNNSNNDSVLIL